MKKHKKLIIIISIVVVLAIFFIWLLLNYSLFDNVNSDYKNTPGYEEYISDRNTGYSFAPYFETDIVMWDSQKARDYYYANCRRVGNFLITDYEDGVCINKCYHKTFNTINIPEKLDGKPVVKIGSVLDREYVIDEYWYNELSPILGFGDCELNIPSTVKYISSRVFLEACEFDENYLDEYFHITKINVDKDNPYYSSENGILFTKDKKSLLYADLSNESFMKGGDIILSENIEIFGGRYYYEQIDTITFSKNIKSISAHLLDGLGSDASNEYPDIDEYDLIVKGYKGTVAEKWAKKYHAKFIPLD